MNYQKTALESFDLWTTATAQNKREKQVLFGTFMLGHSESRKHWNSTATPPQQAHTIQTEFKSQYHSVKAAGWETSTRCISAAACLAKARFFILFSQGTPAAVAFPHLCEQHSVSARVPRPSHITIQRFANCEKQMFSAHGALPEPKKD